jgi:hypothetical protein
MRVPGVKSVPGSDDEGSESTDRLPSSLMSGTDGRALSERDAWCVPLRGDVGVTGLTPTPKSVPASSSSMSTRVERNTRDSM